MTDRTPEAIERQTSAVAWLERVGKRIELASDPRSSAQLRSFTALDSPEWVALMERLYSELDEAEAELEAAAVDVERAIYEARRAVYDAQNGRCARCDAAPLALMPIDDDPQSALLCLRCLSDYNAEVA